MNGNDDGGWRKSVEAARLDVERARLKIEEDKIAIERDRAAIQRYQAQINRWNADVGPHHTYVVESGKAAVGFGQTAIKGLFILNGGALAALAPLRSLFNDLKVPNEAVIHAAISFTTGLVLVCTAAGLSYIGQSVEGTAAQEALRIKAIRINAPVETSEAQIQADPEFMGAEASRARYFRWFNWLRIAAVLSGAGSLVAFTVGAWLLLHYAAA